MKEEINESAFMMVPAVVNICKVLSVWETTRAALSVHADSHPGGNRKIDGGHLY